MIKNIAQEYFYNGSMIINNYFSNIKKEIT